METIPEQTQMLDLLEKQFKSTILNEFKEIKETMSEKLKGTYEDGVSQKRHYS